MKLKLKVFILPLLTLFMVGCLTVPDEELAVPETNSLENLIVPNDFDFSTVAQVEVELRVPEFLSNAVFELYTEKAGTDSINFAKATFNKNGLFQSVYTLPTYIDSILVVSKYLGLVSEVAIPIIDNKAVFDYSIYYNGDNSKMAIASESFTKSVTISDFSYMGAYNSNGVPGYLTTPDVIQQNLLDDINASLPENFPLPQNHPEFLAGSETNIVMAKQGDVWITFVAEGAGWKNALGYYSYPVGQPPATPDDITDLKIVFPNASLAGSGGGLHPGDKVFLGNFKANTVIGWFLVSNGWNGSVVGAGNGIQYSQSNLNAESDVNLKPHMVLLNDETRSQLLLGFEDVPRDWAMCDNDFNDAIFYATANPIDAVATQSVQSLIAANDSDGDGINDELDDFPFDPNKTFNNFSPSQESFGSLAYEDLWPSRGDYDFNDLVVDYNFNQIANADNLITTIEATFVIRHIGGSYHNGFAFTLPINPSKIASIENQVLNVGYTNVSSNGTEVGANESVIFVVENAHPQEGKTISLVINFTQPLSSTELGGVPYNPFIVVDGDRSREVHLPDLTPSASGDYLGTEDDYSDPSKGRYYKTDRNLPWALNIYNNFSIPPEKVSIDQVYPKFVNWANSGGVLDKDWYN